MACFLACFGSSRDRKRRKNRHNKVQPRHQRKEGCSPVRSTVSVVQDCQENPIFCPVSEIRDDPEEKLSLGAGKKVTFCSNVTAYEHVSVEESTDFTLEKEDGRREEKLKKPTQSQASSEDSSIRSDLGSYPPNHRYQNCRDSDDELDYEESDMDDEGDNEEEGEEEEENGGLDYEDDDGVEESRSRVAKLVNEEIHSNVMNSDLSGKELRQKSNVRDRSAPVLHPVENLTQWKAVKAEGKPSLRQQKENLTLDQEPRISFSSQPSLEEFSLSFKAKAEQCKKPSQEVAVDASLSSWLGSSDQCAPMNKPGSIGLDTITPEKSMLLGSNSPRSFDDRPILGALTVEELRKFSVSSSPRKSPSRSPDEMPIIGTVGTYWNHSVSSKGSGSASSYTGIPNTTSKYREVHI